LPSPFADGPPYPHPTPFSLPAPPISLPHPPALTAAGKLASFANRVEKGRAEGGAKGAAKAEAAVELTRGKLRKIGAPPASPHAAALPEPPPLPRRTTRAAKKDSPELGKRKGTDGFAAAAGAPPASPHAAALPEPPPLPRRSQPRS